MICKSSKKKFAKKSINVTNVKLLSKFFFDVFGFFMHFWWKWQLALYILSYFPGIKNLNGPNDLNSLNNLIDLNDLNSLISSKNLYFKVKMYILVVYYFLLLEKAPKSHFEPIYFTLLVWFTYHPVEAAKHQKNKNRWFRHKCPSLMNM